MRRGKGGRREVKEREKEQTTHWVSGHPRLLRDCRLLVAATGRADLGGIAG